MSFLLLVISSPSGAGKTTLCRRLLRELPSLRFSVSTTTRPIRPGEVDGVDYRFVTHGRFREMIEAEAFIEWAHVHGHLYGTARDQVESPPAGAGGILFDVDVQGAARIKSTYPEATTVFLLPPCMRELERRIRTRGTESDEQVGLRLANARGEIARFEEFEYLVVNDDLERGYDRLRSIVVAAGCLTGHVRDVARGLLGSGE